jgi:rhodanese-related sulfurtransferase
MQRKITFLLFFGLMLFQACSQNANTSTQEAKQPLSELLGPEEFKQKMLQEPGILLDIRTHSEQKKGIISSAQCLDFFSDSFEATLNNMDKSKTYYIYCASGGRSSEAAELMIKNGFVHVVDLDGGIKRWKEANLNIEPKN